MPKDHLLLNEASVTEESSHSLLIRNFPDFFFSKCSVLSYTKRKNKKKIMSNTQIVNVGVVGFGKLLLMELGYTVI